MSSIKFSKDERESLVENLQQYFADEMNQELGQFEAEFLLDFFAEKIGCYFYNQGLYDAQAILQSRVELLQEAIGDLEQPTDFAR